MSSADRTLRPLAVGLVAGLGLSLARAPLGVELALTPALSAGEALYWRALALGMVAFGLGRWGGARPRLVPLAWGAVLGFALHGLVLPDAVRLDSRLQLYALVALLAVASWLLRTRERPEQDEREPEAGSLERVGLLVAGAGVAISLEAVARPLRLLGGATGADHAVLGGAFLGLLALGAAAFGPLLPPRLRAPATGLLLALAALAGLEPLRALEAFSSREGLEGFLRSWPWRLDLSEIARLRGDLLLGARVWLAPAFALGVALTVAARGSRLAWVLFGAALGLLAWPTILHTTPVESPELAAVTRLVLGTGLASVGGALATWSAPGMRLSLRVGGALACLAVAGIAVFGPRPAPLPLSPWGLFAVEPEWIADTPEGLLTLEPCADFGRVVTLDRRRLTPLPAGEAADEQRLRLAWNRVQAGEPQTRECRVLLVGQLTPGRARTLLELGATHVDRTAAWSEHMEALESRLFDGAERPPGRVLAPFELGSAGPWALVVVPPVEGPAPLVRPATAGFTPRVVWLAARAGCADLDWGERVLVSSDGLDEVCIAPRQPEGFSAGGRVRPPAPWRRLHQRPFVRETAAVAAALERLAEGARGTEQEGLAAGLVRLAAAQEVSSPFESEAQQIELDPEGLRLLREAALAAEPDLFVRQLWSALARLLAEKREIELVEDYVAPLAERWAPWWQLELALARADLESLDPAAGAEHLLRAVAEQPLDLELRWACAQTLSMASRPTEAVQELRAIEAVQPGRREVRRLLAMELARVGDPEAGPLLDELLVEDPEDDELRAFQGPGPFPAPEVRFDPYSWEGYAHEHEDG